MIGTWRKPSLRLRVRLLAGLALLAAIGLPAVHALHLAWQHHSEATVASPSAIAVDGTNDHGCLLCQLATVDRPISLLPAPVCAELFNLTLNESPLTSAVGEPASPVFAEYPARGPPSLG
jgi:hypothetical protein